MPSPLKNVIYAFMESYLSERKNKWKLNEKDPLYSKLTGTPEQKMIVCKDSLEKIKNAKSANDWLEIVYDLYDKEMVERNIVNNSSLAWFNCKPPSLLASVLSAIRSYIIYEMRKEDAEFLSKTQLLGDQLNNAKLKSSNNYSLKFRTGPIQQANMRKMLEKISLLNSKYKSLTECNASYLDYFNQKMINKNNSEGFQTFEDFLDMVKDGSIQHPLCDKLISQIPSNIGSDSHYLSIVHDQNPPLTDGPSMKQT